MKKMADLIDRNAITLVKSGAYKGCTEQDIYKMREIKRAYLQKMLLEGLKASNTKMTKSAFAYILDAADKFVPGVAMTESQEKFAGLCEAALSAAVNERLALMQKKADGDMMESMPKSMPGQISSEVNMANADPSVLVDPEGGDIIQQLISSAAGLTQGDGVFYGGESGMNELSDQGLDALETTGTPHIANLNDKMFLAVMNKISNLVDMLTKQAAEGDSNVQGDAMKSEAVNAAEAKVEQGNNASVAEVKPDPNVNALAANTIQDNYTQITEKKVEDPAMVAAASNPEQKTAKKASMNIEAMCNSFYNQIKVKK